MRTKKRFVLLLALLTTFSLVAASCSDDDDGAGAGTTPTEQAADSRTSDGSGGSDGSGSNGSDDGNVAAPIGDACSAIPTDGEGSSAGMADDTAGTAASNNPVLSTVVSAVGAADLVDALNDPDAEYTIFAPANTAFEKIPADTLNGLLQPDQKDALTDILTYHVYAGGKLDLDEIVDEGTLEMLNGDSVEVSADGETATINGESMVICGNVTTSNATVHIIDTVLMPPS